MYVHDILQVEESLEYKNYSRCSAFYAKIRKEVDIDIEEG